MGTWWKPFLAEIGYLIKAQLRLIDFAFRYGGDEFVVLLPQTSKDQAVVVAMRLQESMRAGLSAASRD